MDETKKPKITYQEDSDEDNNNNNTKNEDTVNNNDNNNATLNNDDDDGRKAQQYKIKNNFDEDEDEGLFLVHSPMPFKVSCARWPSEQISNALQLTYQVFVTGSWDAQVELSHNT